MGDDKLLVKDTEHFTNQATLHRNVAEHTRQMVSKHQTFHDNLVAAAQGTCMGDALNDYIQWWEGFSTHLLGHADLHDQMAGHLETAVGDYQDADKNVGKSFTPQDQGGDSSGASADF